MAGADPASDEWWAAVQQANDENSDHMAEEERGPLAACRRDVGRDIRRELGSRFVAFNTQHAGGRDVDTSDKDPAEFIEDHSPGR